MLNVVLIEDNKAYADSLYDAAYLKGILVTHFQGLEEGMLLLKEHYKDYQGLILDGRGWLSEDRKHAVDSHIHSAINDLTQLRAQGIYIPYVVNTGFFQELAGQIQYINPEVIFDKAHGMEPMFTKLLSLINEAPIQKLKAKYPEPFQSFGGKYLPENSLEKLATVLGRLEETTIKTEYFKLIRDLVEVIFKRANSIDNVNFLPSALFNANQNMRPNIRYCERYLMGREVSVPNGPAFPAKALLLPDDVSWTFTALCNNCQIQLHDGQETKLLYRYRSSTYALIEILIWFKNYVDQHYP